MLHNNILQLNQTIEEVRDQQTSQVEDIELISSCNHLYKH